MSVLQKFGPLFQIPRVLQQIVEKYSTQLPYLFTQHRQNVYEKAVEDCKRASETMKQVSESYVKFPSRQFGDAFWGRLIRENFLINGKSSVTYHTTPDESRSSWKPLHNMWDNKGLFYITERSHEEVTNDLCRMELEECNKDDPCYCPPKKAKDKNKNKGNPCKKKEDKDDSCKKKDDKDKDSCTLTEDKCRKGGKDDKKKKNDPCKKKEDKKKDDPCKKKEDKKKDDPCKKKDDKKKGDPCKKKDDPCKKKKDDPCKKKKDDPCKKKKDDPCKKKKDDPCKKKEDKKKDDPCKKKKDDPCKKKKDDPCKKKDDKKKDDPCKKKDDKKKDEPKKPNCGMKDDKKKDDPCKKKDDKKKSDPCKKKDDHKKDDPCKKKDDKKKNDPCKKNKDKKKDDPCKKKNDKGKKSCASLGEECKIENPLRLRQQEWKANPRRAKSYPLFDTKTKTTPEVSEQEKDESGAGAERNILDEVDVIDKEKYATAESIGEKYQNKEYYSYKNTAFYDMNAFMSSKRSQQVKESEEQTKKPVDKGDNK